MKNVEMRRLEESDYPAFEAYVKDWLTDESPFKVELVEKYLLVSKENFPDWLKRSRREETEVESENWSTMTSYYAIFNGAIAGTINCRWQIEKGDLLKWGGHIGYGVAPSYRGHHLAEQMVNFALEEYKKRGVLRVMISADEDNIASRKTIERCGGRLENIVTIDERKICRYWIDL